MPTSLFSHRAGRIVDGYTGQMEPPISRQELRNDAIQEEFEYLINDPDTIENAFAEGFRIDAVCAALWAQLARESSPSLYEAVAKRLEHSLREKIWDFATENVDGRAE